MTTCPYCWRTDGGHDDGYICSFTRQTSRAALASVADELNDMQAQVAQFIASQGRSGATDEEIIAATGMNPSTVRPRRGELAKMGRISVATDERGAPVRRPTRSGRLANVWVSA